ncbi:MAG: hypothetical protein NT077_00900 [Candidatus Taylorbacteria bacterium]|nr:hypothetical protein [Candidatus Taylorbacteria bacterium]
MTQTKKAHTIKNDDVEDVAPIKIKPRELDLEGNETFPLDKVIEEVEVTEETEDSEELGDVVELDEEEINPFKDKWEE